MACRSKKRKTRTTTTRIRRTMATTRRRTTTTMTRLNDVKKASLRNRTITRIGRWMTIVTLKKKESSVRLAGS